MDSAGYGDSSERFAGEPRQAEAKWDDFPRVSEWKATPEFEARVKAEIEARERDIERWERQGAVGGAAFTLSQSRQELEDLRGQYVAVFVIAERFPGSEAA